MLVGAGVAATMLPTGAPAAEPSDACAAPVHTAVGVGPPVYGSGYAQSATGTIRPAVSRGSAQPFALKLAVWPLASVIVGIASVLSAPVGVYVGTAVNGTVAGTPESVGGGHCPYDASADAATTPSPAPVAAGAYVPLKRGTFTSYDAHVPFAVRGSFGIHPFWSPSWYDHSGVLMSPLTSGPICDRDCQRRGYARDNDRRTFQVQKNQFCSVSMLASAKLLMPSLISGPQFA